MHCKVSCRFDDVCCILLMVQIMCVFTCMCAYSVHRQVTDGLHCIARPDQPPSADPAVLQGYIFTSHLVAPQQQFVTSGCLDRYIRPGA